MSTRTTIDQTVRAVRATEREQICTRMNYTERASRHYRTSRERVGVELDFCIAMVFGPQPMLGCTGQARGRLGYRRIYVLSPNSAFPSVSPCASTLPLPPFRPRRASLITHPARALVAHIGAPPKACISFKFVHTLRTLMFATMPAFSHSSSVAGGGPTGSTMLSMQWRRTASTFVPIPTLM